jgi:hypothetical protein
MAQVVSRWPLTAEGRVQFRTIRVGCDADRVALGKDFLPVLLFSPVSVIPAHLFFLKLGYFHQKNRRAKSAKTSNEINSILYVSDGQGNTFPPFEIDRDSCFEDAGPLARETASLGEGLQTFRENAMPSSRLKQ